MGAGTLPYRKYCVFNKGWRICRGIRRGDVSKIHNFRNDMDDLAIMLARWTSRVSRRVLPQLGDVA